MIPAYKRGLLFIEKTKYGRNYLPLELDGFKLPVNYEKSNDYAREASAAISSSEALSLLKMAIDCCPKNYGPYVTRAEIFMKNKQFSEALANLNQGIVANPTVPELYQKRVTVLCALNQFALALANANALVQLNPCAENLCLRADVRAKMKDKDGVIHDLNLAVIAHEEVGEDAMDDVDRLEALTGKKFQRPAVPAADSEKMLQKIVTTLKNGDRFDSMFVQKSVDAQLYEIPIKGEQSTKTSEFGLRSSNRYFSELNLHTKASNDGPYLNIIVNTAHCFITLPQILKNFGPPQASDDDPPGEIAYRLPWGFITFEFYRHGFKLVKAIYVSEHSQRYGYLQSAGHR